jgi:hypothetical protein
MRRGWISAVALTAIGIAASPTRADVARLRVEGGALLLECPKGWQAVRSGPAKEPVIRLLAADPRAFRVVISAAVRGNDVPSEEQVQALVKEDQRSMLQRVHSHEASDLAPLRGPSALGYTYHLVDSTSRDVGGDYRELDRGIVVVGPLVLRLSVFTHRRDTAVAKTALELIGNARFEPSVK